MVKNLKDMTTWEIIAWSCDNDYKIMHSKFHQERNPHDVLRATLRYNIAHKVIDALRGGTQPETPHGKFWMAYLVRWAELVSDRYNRRITETEFYQQATQNRDFLYRNLIVLDWAAYFDKPNEDIMTVAELYEHYVGKPPVVNGCYAIRLGNVYDRIYWVEKKDDKYKVFVDAPAIIDKGSRLGVFESDGSHELRINPSGRTEPVLAEDEYWNGAMAYKAGRRSVERGIDDVQSDKESPAGK